MSTAGLSRAYAVLRQLDVLRAESITNPLPTTDGICTCEESGDRGDSKAVRPPLQSRCESTVRRVRLQASQPSTPPERRGQRTSSEDAFSEHSIRVGAAQMSSPLFGAAPHRFCFSEHPHVYAPVHSHLSHDSLRHDRPHQRDPPQPAAAGEGHHAPAASARTEAQPRRSALSDEYTLTGAYDYHAPPPPIHSSGSTSLHSSSPSHPAFSRHRYNTEVVAGERPARRSPPARVGVPSPVVLPSLSTSEAAHVAAAQASSTLEVYFDKDDMGAVLASVGAVAAVAASPALVGRTQQGGHVGQPPSVQPAVSAADEDDAACITRPRTAHGARRGAGGTADSAHGFGAAAKPCASPDATATPSSLSNSTLTAMPDGDAESTNVTSLAAIADDGQHPLWQLPASSNDECGKPHCRGSGAAASASTKELSVTSSAGRLLDALHSVSRSVGQPRQREATATTAVAPLFRLSCPPPSGDLPSFYTAAGHSALPLPSARALWPAAAPKGQQEEEGSCSSPDGRLSQREMPSPRNGADVALSLPEALVRCGREEAGADRSGCTGGDDDCGVFNLNSLSADRVDEGDAGRGAGPRGVGPAPLRGLFDADEERPAQRAAADDGPQRRNTNRRPQGDARGQSVTGGGRCDPMPLFPAAYTKAVPFLDYLTRINAASSHQLLKELTAMGDAWTATTQAEHEAGCGDAHLKEVTESVVVDCLAMDLLLNKPSALECIVVPWLRTRLESMMATRSAERTSSSLPYSRGRRSVVAANALSCTEQVEAESVREGDAAANNSVLCAIIGLGGAAFTLLSTLLQLLLWLPPSSPTSVCDVRLVGLAIRTAGGADGLQALIRTLQGQEEGPHVLAAAAYALSTYSFELAGHTSVVCIPTGAMCHLVGGEGAAELFQLVPGSFAATDAASTSATPMMEELQPLWSRNPFLSHTSTTAVPTRPHLLYLQSPPPYRHTHVMVDAEVARCKLMAHLCSDQFHSTHAHPHVMALLNDALSARLLSAVLIPAVQTRYCPVVSQMRRDLHRVLADDAASIASRERAHTGSSDTGSKPAALPGLLRLPLLPYSLHHFAGEKDTLFALESALVHALLARPAAALVQEQVLLSLSTLPPEARVHVVQPVTDFFIRLARTLQLRQTMTMRRPLVQAACSSPFPTDCGPYGRAEEVDADEAVAVSAALAAGTVCVNPLASCSCVDSCVAALVPVFKELLHSPLWRVRHAACVGLARIGPLTADPSSIIDVLLTRLGLHAPLITGESGSSASPSAAAMRPLPLQSATVVWCLTQQGPGGVRALLQLLQDPQQPPQVHHWSAFQLAEVDVHETCAQVSERESSEASALLDEFIQALGRLIATQGALEEDTVLLCVRALAEVVHRYYTTATSPTNNTDAPMFAALSLDTAQPTQEAASCYQEEEPNSCFTVLTSVAEAALLPNNVLKALCLYLCRYGGRHGELYACELLLQGSSVGGRAAAAFGLRACGAKALRSVVLGMNDDSFDVRRESFETLTSIGAAAALEVLRQRPAEHRHQVRDVLRDCLLRDASRPLPRKVAETVYRALQSEELLSAQELS
ncbi:hypothetical protein LSCM1_03289 [Leishmania martiniquensis]|uniref:Uncharacterized protein n=1 Tax=Leishmania martiniquensis TaxID=1580590 RepID=A0A836KQI7_9TRYP|nr:hypothetical protein LSCM1_03289 [Leishmania martiniquensis]